MTDQSQLPCRGAGLVSLGEYSRLVVDLLDHAIAAVGRGVVIYEIEALYATLDSRILDNATYSGLNGVVVRRLAH